MSFANITVEQNKTEYKVPDELALGSVVRVQDSGYIGVITRIRRNFGTIPINYRYDALIVSNANGETIMPFITQAYPREAYTPANSDTKVSFNNIAVNVGTMHPDIAESVLRGGQNEDC